MSNASYEPINRARDAAKEARTCLISLIMATYGRSDELKLALQSLLDQTDRNFELIVVDQNQDERIAPHLDPLIRAGLTVSHLRYDRPHSSAARNKGLAAAKGDVVAFPDDDCWYEPGVVEGVRRYFAANPDVDGVAARWVELEPIELPCCKWLSLEDWRRFRGGHVTAITLFARNDRVRALGGFDEAIGPGSWYGSSEDTDLVLRMLARGWRLTYVPNLLIHHPHFEAPPLTRAQCWRQRSYGRGIGVLYVKHRLSVWVVARGLTAPLWRAARAPRPAAALVLGACTIFGRVEGMFGWLMRALSNEPSP